MNQRILAFDAEQTCRMFCHPVRTGLGQVSVRPISPADAGLAQAFVVNLSGTSRYFRFFQALRSLSPAMLERFTRVDYTAHIALVGVATDGGAASIVAEALRRAGRWRVGGYRRFRRRSLAAARHRNQSADDARTDCRRHRSRPVDRRELCRQRNLPAVCSKGRHFRSS